MYVKNVVVQNTREFLGITYVNAKRVTTSSAYMLAPYIKITSWNRINFF